jgi:glycerol-3-phosphate dehydrogenase (NAD+)
VAVPDLAKAVEGATALVFVMPHQFLDKCLDTIEGHIAPGAKAISLIKVSAGAGGCRGATGAWAGR